MRRTGIVRATCAWLLALLVVLSLPGTDALAAPMVDRLNGADRYQTMQMMGEEAFSSSSWAVVASGEDYPDALAAAGLAGMRRAPVVLTGSSSLSGPARALLESLGVRNVCLVGGEGAVSEAVADEIGRMGISVSRVAGADRVSTSVEAMRACRAAGSLSDCVIVASGAGFADAVSMGPWAWSSTTPVVLTRADGTLSADAVAAIRADGLVRRVVVLGGPAAVSESVADQLGGSYEYERLQGADRYETSAQVATWTVGHGFSWSNVLVATGEDYPDALVASSYGGATDSPVLLASTRSNVATNLVRELGDDVLGCVFLGGTSALPAELENAFSSLDASGALVLEPKMDDVLIGGEERQAFYAKSAVSVGSVTLHSLDADPAYVQMFDDGDRANHADDNAGDGIYSCFFDPGVMPTEDATLSFQAEADEVVSQKVYVDYFLPFSDNELRGMEEVNKAIAALIDDEAYWQKSYVQRAQAADGLLQDLANRGLIDRSSISQDVEGGTIHFSYSNGVYGNIETDIHGDEGSGDLKHNGGELADQLLLDAQAYGNPFGTAIIANSFPAFEKTEADKRDRYEPYRRMHTKWNNAGLQTQLWEENDTTEISVNSYRQLDRFNVILIATHGSRNKVRESDGTEKEYSCITLGEACRPEKDQRYAVELKDHQIIGGRSYELLPKFFEAQYKQGALKNSFVVLECCEGFGSKGKNDTTLAMAFINRGSSAVVGFQENVFAGYSRSFAEAYIDGLVSGKSSYGSYENACNTIGSTERVWYKNYIGKEYGAEARAAKGDPAISNHIGFNHHTLR